MPSDPPSQRTLVPTRVSAYLHIDTALACGLQGVHTGNTGQNLLLKYQPVGRLNAEGVPGILSGSYSQADFLGRHVGGGGVFGQGLERDDSILRKTACADRSVGHRSEPQEPYSP